MEDNIFTISFSDLEDPRITGRTAHSLIEIIGLAICSVICGADTWTEIELFCKLKIDWFKKFFQLKNGIPSHDTFGRVFSLINADEFRKCFNLWISSVNKIIQDEIIAIDGKTLRRSFDKVNGKSAIHMVSAWASNAGMVLGQIKVDDKSNEITAIPKLLDLLVTKNCIVTIDAMGCQKNIAAKIIEKKSDYVLALKGNQGNLHNDIKLFFDDCLNRNFKDISNSYYETFDKDHGRIEKRKYWITKEINWINDKNEWKGLKSIGIGISEVEEKGLKRTETRYFITSLDENAEKFGDAVRKHWKIETSLHWVLDIAFREDENRVRTDFAPENFAVIRHLALDIIKQDKSKGSIRCKRLKAGWDNNFLENLLFKKF